MAWCPPNPNVTAIKDIWSETLFKLQEMVEPVISAEVKGRDGTTRTVAEGGIILTADQELILTFNNPLQENFPVTIYIAPYGKDGQIFDNSGMNVSYDKQNRYYYLTIPQNTASHQVRLPIREDSEGGMVKVVAFIPASYPSLKNVPIMRIKEFNFTVGCFRIKFLDFKPWQDGDKDIYLFSTLSPDIYQVNRPVITLPTVEWSNNYKTASHEHYDYLTTSPAVYKKDDKLRINIAYECHGLDGATILGVCTPDSNDSSGALYCPFGDIEEKRLDCGSYPSGFSANHFSSQSVSKVSASLNPFTWKIYSSQLGFNQETAYEVENTEHRIYVILAPPIELKSNNFPPIELLELATYLGNDATDCLSARDSITINLWLSKWIEDKEMFRYIYPRAKLTYYKGGVFPSLKETIYNKGKMEPNKMVWPSIYFLKTPLHYLENDDVFNIECGGISGFYELLVNSIGCDEYHVMAHYDDWFSTNLTFKKLHAFNEGIPHEYSPMPVHYLNSPWHSINYHYRYDALFQLGINDGENIYTGGEVHTCEISDGGTSPLGDKCWYNVLGVPKEQYYEYLLYLDPTKTLVEAFGKVEKIDYRLQIPKPQ